MSSFKSAAIATAVFGLSALVFCTTAMADKADNIVNTLVAKGLLTEEEGALLLKDNNSDNQVPATKKPTEIRATLSDGIGFESTDGQHALSINGRVQTDYHAYAGNDAQNTDSFDIRRAYMTVKGKLYGDYDFNVTGDFAQGQNGNPNDQLDSAYLGINWWSKAKLRIGQFDMPFGLEHSTSDLFTDFTERGLTEALTPSKERGVMVYGVPIRGTYYGFALSNGRGKNSNNADSQVDGVDMIGRATANLAELLQIKGATYHIGAAFSKGDISPHQKTNSGVLSTNSFLVGQGSTASQTEGRGITFFTPTSLGTPAGSEVERTRTGVEGAIAFGPVKLQSEWMKHSYAGHTALATSGYFNKDITAWYASVNWLLTGESYTDVYKDGIWGRIKPKNNFTHNESGFSGSGAWVLGLRYSEYDASDFANGTGAGAVGTFNVSGTPGSFKTPDGAHSLTAGVTWILNPNLRLAANYIDTRFVNGSIAVKNDLGIITGTTNAEKALTLRGALDF